MSLGGSYQQEVDLLSLFKDVAGDLLGRRPLDRTRCSTEEDLRRAADVLNEGERVAMLIGQGAIGAAEEVREVADILACGVAKALTGRAALPGDLALRHRGYRPARDEAEQRDDHEL